MSAPSHRLRSTLAQKAVVVDRVVGPVDDQVLTVDPEPRGLGDLGSEVFDVVTCKDRDRDTGLRPDHDRSGRTLEVVGERLVQPIHPGGAGVGVLEIHPAGRIGNPNDSVIREQQRRTDVVDHVIADRDSQHLRILVAGSIRVLRVERVVPTKVKGRTLDPVDDVTVLIVGRHGRGAALECAQEIIRCLSKQRTATCGQTKDHQNTHEGSGDFEATRATSGPTGRCHLSPLSLGLRASTVDQVDRDSVLNYYYIKKV